MQLLQLGFPSSHFIRLGIHIRNFKLKLKSLKRTFFDKFGSLSWFFDEGPLWQVFLWRSWWRKILCQAHLQTEMCLSEMSFRVWSFGVDSLQRYIRAHAVYAKIDGDVDTELMVGR